jgi:hypothetical protein
MLAMAAYFLTKESFPATSTQHNKEGGNAGICLEKQLASGKGSQEKLKRQPSSLSFSHTTS